MKRVLRALSAFGLVLGLFIVLGLSPLCMAAQPAQTEAETGGVLVTLRDPDLIPFDGRAQLMAAAERERLIPLSPSLRIYLTGSVDNVRELVYSGQVARLEPDYKAELFDIPAVPNDSYFVSDPAYQYNLRGQYSIQVQSAWDAGLTGDGVTVAVIDSGINLDHADLPLKVTTGRYYYFRETLSTEEGYEDAVPLVINGKEIMCNLYSSGIITDNVGHGTSVSGIIAANTNNTVGIAGAAPGVTIMPIRCFTNTPGHYGGYTSGLIAGIDYATEHHADIINMSWGIPNDSDTLYAAVTRAVNAGCILIAAAGNDGPATPRYPAAFDNVISVGATDRNGLVCDFSQRVSSVNICAPGENIYSLGYSDATRISVGSGTSFATPLVVAAAALLKENDPLMTQGDFLALLANNSDPVLLGSWRNYSGYGRINLRKLLDAVGRSSLHSDATALGCAVRGAYHPVQKSVTPPEELMLLLAAYNADGHLLESSTALAPLSDYGAYSIEANFTAEDIATVRVFFLEGDALVPATDALERQLIELPAETP